MYEHMGERYFVVDSHIHFWDASSDNWIAGQEQFARGWIQCLHAYNSIGPDWTYRTLERFERCDEAHLLGDIFKDGYVDVAIFQPLYLKDWFRNGFETTSRDGSLAERHPGKFIVNTRFDPREGDAGLAAFEQTVSYWGARGIMLEPAEWKGTSRGWKLTDPAAYRYLTKAQEIGVKNIHVPKGLSFYPLGGASDLSDIDQVATDFPELNFIVEHAGVARIEDFCLMASPEPNVYAGLAGVIGALMHARPRFFAKVMGELLFWIGEDKMLFGSDYAIWEPRWQVEGFVDWEMPDSDEFADYPRLYVDGKKKILGLNAARLYGIDVPYGRDVFERFPRSTQATPEIAE